MKLLLIPIIILLLIPMTTNTIVVENEYIEEPIFVGYREVTSYTLGRVAETDDSPCIGAYGNLDLCELAKTTTICASNEFPRDIILRVGSIKCVVMDKLNSRYKNRIDIASLNYNESSKFGIQELRISIIKLD